MKVGKTYRSKRNGRLYKCFYKSEYEEIYSMLPLHPTELEKHIYPFPHIRVYPDDNDWMETDQQTAEIERIERIDNVYIIDNQPV